MTLNRGAEHGYGTGKERQRSQNKKQLFPSWASNFPGVLISHRVLETPQLYKQCLRGSGDQEPRKYSINISSDDAKKNEVW